MSAGTTRNARTTRNVRILSIPTALILALMACADAPEPDLAAPGTSPITASPTRPTASASPAGPTTATSPPACPRQAEEPSHERSAQCLYAAFVTDDRDVAATYATTEAVEETFRLGGYATDAQWEFEECGAPRESQPSSGVACHYRIRIPGQPHGVYVEMLMREDFIVEDVVSVG